MFDNSYLFYVFCIVLILFYLFNRKPTATVEHLSDAPESAAEACKKISSRAEEIKAVADGAAKMIDSVMGIFSPNNYKGGDNTVNSTMRNIITTDMSKEFEAKIKNECSNSSASMQLNEIDFTKCKYCETHECSVTNVTQENINKSEQTCQLKAAIDVLMTKKDSVDAQAVAKVMQESEGLLSGNNSTSTENCNVIKKDMSTKEYLDLRSSCHNSISNNQKNSLKNCGPVSNVMQRNLNKQIQKCIMDSSVVSKTELESETKTSQEIDVTQKSIGLDMMSIIILICSCCICCSVLSALSGVGAAMSQGGSGSEFPQMPKMPKLPKLA